MKRIKIEPLAKAEASVMQDFLKNAFCIVDGTVNIIDISQTKFEGKNYSLATFELTELSPSPAMPTGKTARGTFYITIYNALKD